MRAIVSTANLDPEQLPAFNGDPIGDSFDFHNDALFSVPSIALSHLLGWLAKKYAFEPDLETVCSVVGTQLDVGLVAIIMRDLRDPRLNSTAVVAVWERASDKQFANRLSSIETDQWSELFSVSRSPTRQITSPVGQASPTMLNVAEALQQQLLRTGLTQPLAKPIIVQGQLSGFAIFDQIRTPHEWTQDTTLRFLALQHGIFMERQLERQSVLAIQQTLFRAIRLKSEVTSRLSHELRTPLTGIKGMLDLIGETRLD
jgi:signal transduction histidine kinase